MALDRGSRHGLRLFRCSGARASHRGAFTLDRRSPLSALHLPIRRTEPQARSHTAAETPQLWNWDVAETFLGSDLANIVRYKEFQVSPQGEWIDLDINRTKGARGGGAAWNSGMQVKARVDAAAKVWYGEMKIPFEALFEGAPAAGRELRAGFFRIAGVDPAKKKISWQATGTKTFHVPEKFGILRLVE
jgi:hypothetical protein